MSLIAPNLKTIDEACGGTVLVVGPWQHGEFAIARRCLEASATVTSVKDSVTASATLTAGELVPAYILLAQPEPGTVTQDEIERLRSAAPLAQLVIVAGTWCEGELRTGRPPIGVLRLYWYELEGWWRALENNAASAPRLDGPLAPRHVQGPQNITVPSPVVIHSLSLATFEALSSALAASGIPSVWFHPSSQLPERATAGIWDGGQLDDVEWVQLEKFATETRALGATLIVLLDFPRKEHFARLHEIGCTSILGKPYIVGELVAAIARLV